MEASTRKIKIGTRTITLETGRIARQASAAVLVREGATAVLVTVTAAPEPRPDMDFFPLTVEYREKLAAAGRIPGSWLRREGRITDREVLISRLVDRSIRPLFPKGYKNEVQVTATVLSAGSDSDPAPLAIMGAGAALHLSPIPWNGPAGGVRVVLLEDRLVVLPNPAEMEQALADVVVSTGPEGLVMVEGGALVVPEEQILEMLFTGQDALAPFLETLDEWRREAGREKAPFTPPEIPAEIMEEARRNYGEALKQALRIPQKQPRRAAVARIEKEALAAEEDPDRAQAVAAALSHLEHEILRRGILDEDFRPDGRGPTDIRPIWVEAGWLEGPHGSAVFTRGETQALVTCTLAGESSAQTIETLSGPEKVNFLLHYNFPPYSVGEVRPLRGPGRREIGHGFLARRALLGVLPPYEDFPYIIRVESDITESNGSSSMATVCGGCLALMDAGVPLSAPVAGIAMGLIQEGEKHVILSDILGDEDHLGDMDFKVAGTEDGVTAIQMDNKIGGLSREVMSQAMDQARRGRLHILSRMKDALGAPRKELPPDAPRAFTLRIRPQSIGLLIGPKGQTIRAIQEETKVELKVDEDGLVTVYAPDGRAARDAMKRIRAAAGDVQKGKVYRARVVKVLDYGAFVQIYPHIEGLVHASQWDENPVDDMTRAAKEGDTVLVRVMGADSKGRLVLSRKEALGVDPSDAAN